MGNHVPTSAPAIKTMEYFAGVLDGKLTELFSQLTGLQINESGNTAGRATYDAEAAGFVYYDSQAGLLYQKQSATSGNWSDGLSLVAAMQALIDDTTPQLGGNLDIQAFLIVGNGGTQGIAIDAAGNVGVGGITSPTAALHTPSLNVGAADASSAVVEIGAGATGDRLSLIDFHSDTTYTDYSLRIIRNAGANAVSQILHRGTGNMQMGSQDAAKVSLITTSLDRISIEAGGDVLIGAGTPSTKLQVDGPIKCASYTVATVPAAATVGAGTQIYVTNETGGATPAWSDGATWRRASDRAAISS